MYEFQAVSHYSWNSDAQIGIREVCNRSAYVEQRAHFLESFIATFGFACVRYIVGGRQV
jgi:hypothetical protein